jgi:hypothetical protein
MDTVISVVMMALMVWGIAAPLVVIFGMWYLRARQSRKGKKDV